MTPEELVRAAWPAAAGKIVAGRTRAVSLVRETLLVEVEDSTWQRQLNTLKPQIIRKLQELAGAGNIADLAFKPMTPRRGPQRAESNRPLLELSGDEADQIADPVLRSVYKTSRKKASA